MDVRPRQNERHQFFFPNARALMREVTLVADNAVLNFKFGRSRAHIHELVGVGHEFGKIERPIVERAGEPETIFDKHRLA